MENTSSTFAGILYVVATPIGNLDDISLRAIATLKAVDTILAEDTRHSLPLLKALGIQKPLVALHDHNEAQRCEPIIEAMKAGKSYALISDAGTPLISDPGFILVRKARESGIKIVPIPGACALITALCAAGVPCDSFLFVGFLPAKHQARLSKLEALQLSQHTVVIYESTHRIIECIDDIIIAYGDDYSFVLAKEITKNFEHFIHKPGADIKQWLLDEKARIKGEFVVILPACIEKTKNEETELLRLLLSELPLKQAVKLTSLHTKTPKNDVYKMALEIQENSQNP